MKINSYNIILKLCDVIMRVCNQQTNIKPRRVFRMIFVMYTHTYKTSQIVVSKLLKRIKGKLIEKMS